MSLPSWDFCPTFYGPLDLLMRITAVGVRAGWGPVSHPCPSLHPSLQGWLPGIQLCGPDKSHPALAVCLFIIGIVAQTEL